MTVQDYLDGAYAKYKGFTPGKIVAESTEGLDLVNRVLRMFCQLGVRANPAFFMDEELVSWDASELVFAAGWIRPATAEAVLKITFISESEETDVAVVPWDDRAAENLKPAVYRRGQVYRPAGNANDPLTTDDLTFYFAARPADAVALADDIDPLFPEAFSELPMYEMATVMAIKDKQPDVAASLASERDAWLRMYLTFLQHETMNETRRWDTRFNIPSAMPIMLAGGTSVALPGVGSSS